MSSMDYVESSTHCHPGQKPTTKAIIKTAAARAQSVINCFFLDEISPFFSFSHSGPQKRPVPTNALLQLSQCRCCGIFSTISSNKEMEDNIIIHRLRTRGLISNEVSTADKRGACSKSPVNLVMYYDNAVIGMVTARAETDRTGLVSQ